MQDQALPSPIQTPGEPPRRSLQEIVLRMQALLGERIDRTRETLRASEVGLVHLQESEAKVAVLEAELEKARGHARDFEIRLRKMEAENKALRSRIAPLEKQKQAAELQASQLREATQRLQETACLEIGRAVKALLPHVRLGLLKRPSLSEKAALLTDSGIIDADWYLKQHPDVAAAGMEAGVHYVLHGADEGRVTKSALDTTA